jgi:uncharacterized protein (DUF2267 family)
MMDYQEFIDEVMDLDFIEDEDIADAGIKAVLGILAGNIPEDEAQLLTEGLPQPLSYEKLRGMQKNITGISAEQYIAEIADQFDIDEDDARTLINTVIQVAKDAAGNEVFNEVEDALPPDWVEILQEV